ncbi:MAG: ACT domain-containing protein [Gemmatimonadaceae bacterium]|nr:ACT domain-containing protein [Gemmatimonadaceae bacterium]
MVNPSPASLHPLSITVLATPLALCRLAPTEAIPSWALLARAFVTISRTPTELSVVADDAVVPPEASGNRPYRALRLEGPFALDLVGILAPLATVLADAKVPILPIATYDTDYVLVRESALSRALDALTRAGYPVVVEAA